MKGSKLSASPCMNAPYIIITLGLLQSRDRYQNTRSVLVKNRRKMAEQSCLGVDRVRELGMDFKWKSLTIICLLPRKYNVFLLIYYTDTALAIIYFHADYLSLTPPYWHYPAALHASQPPRTLESDPRPQDPVAQLRGPPAFP